MKTETFHLELITPSFCGGAEPDRQAEIRAPAIRGQLRWWFRTLGATPSEEQRIFGAVSGGTAGASRLQVRVRQGVAHHATKNLEDYTGRQGNDAMKDPESYFLWPLRPFEKDGQRHEQRRACLGPKPGTSAVPFEVQLRFAPQLGHAEVTRVRSALQIWSLLGSLGTRALKGYGSIWPSAKRPMTQSQLASMLLPMPKNSVYLWKTGFTGGRQALAWAATEFKKLRCGTSRFAPPTASTWGKNDHDAADRAVTFKPDKVFRAVFGLPLKQSFRRLPPGRPYGFDVFTEWSGVSRFASPLHIKIGLLDTGYCVLLVFFDSHALPHGTSVQLRDGPNSRTVQIDHGLWNHMKALGRCLH